jgi:(p)ppGpp synthase/HD superfamily hydrolase
VNLIDYMVRHAQIVATTAHAAVGQKRKYTGEPYIVHPRAVVMLAQKAEICTAEMIAAAWLHDTVEDCEGITGDRIRDAFGPEVAGIVAELTDDKSLPKAERKRRQVASAPGKSPRAALIKCADKTSNVAAVGASPPVHWGQARREAYLDWGAEVVAALPHLPAEARAGFAAALALARTRLAFR